MKSLSYYSQASQYCPQLRNWGFPMSLLFTHGADVVFPSETSLEHDYHPSR
jgi:hypothetical protein